MARDKARLKGKVPRANVRSKAVKKKNSKAVKRGTKALENAQQLLAKAKLRQHEREMELDQMKMKMLESENAHSLFMREMEMAEKERNRKRLERLLEEEDAYERSLADFLAKPKHEYKWEK